MGKRKATSFWFSVRVDHGPTLHFDAFSKSTPLRNLQASISATLGINVEEYHLSHKGKLLSNPKKLLLDYDVKEGDLLVIYERQALSSPIDDTLISTLEVPQNKTPVPQLASAEVDDGEDSDSDDGTSCPECGLGGGGVKNIVCDECLNWFHWACLRPVITALPDGPWYCADCTNDTDIVVRPDNEPKGSKKRKSTSWGHGMANQRLSKVCPYPNTHRGSIPGIEVGQTWQYRKLCAEDGIHRALISGIHGSANSGGAVSIVMSGGYDTDSDNGDSFLYTGSGGFASTGSRTNQRQVMDQKLTRYNLALAATCNAKVNKNGAVALNWRKSKAIRVVRGSAGNTPFCPNPVGDKACYRYDGLYKVVRYFQTTPLAGRFKRYIFELRRDDRTPAPWTSDGQALIKQMGLKMVLPQPTKKERPNKSTSRSMEALTSTPTNIDQSQPKSKNSQSKTHESSKRWIIPKDIQTAIEKAISATPSHDRIFAPFIDQVFANKREFTQFLQENITCPLCKDFVSYPVTNPCGHIACLACIKLSVQSAYGCKCPLCSASLLASTQSNEYGDSEFARNLARVTFLDTVKVDEDMVRVLRLCLGTYCENFELNFPYDSSQMFNLISTSPTQHPWDPQKEVDIQIAQGMEELISNSELQQGSDEEASQDMSWEEMPGFREQRSLHFCHHMDPDMSGEETVHTGFARQKNAHINHHDGQSMDTIIQAVLKQQQDQDQDQDRKQRKSKSKTRKSDELFKNGIW